MWIKTTLLVALLVVVLLQINTAAAQTCPGYGACINGTCVTTAAGSPACSCHSGFSGAACDQQVPASQCPVSGWAVLEALATNTVPRVATGAGASTGVTAGTFALDVRSPLVKNRLNSEVQIVDGSGDDCAYPGTAWAKSTLDNPCEDRFQATMTWINALNCGWDVRDTADERVLTGDITVRHRDAVGDLRGVPIIRTMQHMLPMRISMPRRVTVSTTVRVVSAVDLLAVITEQSYNADDRQAKLVLATSVQWPYVVTRARVVNAAAGVSVVSSLGGDCSTDPDSACLQSTTMMLTPSNETCSFSGQYVVELEVECRGPASACPLTQPSTTTVTLDVTSEDICATIDIDIGLTATMAAYNDAAHNTVATTFAPNARAYFKAVVVSDAGVAAITRVRLIKTKVTFGANTELVFDNSALTAAGTTAGFTVDSQEAGGVTFSANLDETVFPVVGDSAEFEVTAVLEVDYVPPQRPGSRPQTMRLVGSGSRTVARAAVQEPGSSQATETASIVISGAVGDSEAQAEADTGSSPMGPMAGGIAGGVVALVGALGVLACCAFIVVVVVVAVVALAMVATGGTAGGIGLYLKKKAGRRASIVGDEEVDSNGDAVISF